MKYLTAIAFLFLIASVQALSLSSLGSSGGADVVRVLDSHQIIYAEEMESLGIKPEKIIGDVALVSKGALQKGFKQQQFKKLAKDQVVVTLGSSSTLGISDGQIILEYFDQGAVDTLLQDYPVQLVLELHGLNRVVVKIRELNHLKDLLQQLSDDYRVKSTELMVNYGDPELQ